MDYEPRELEERWRERWADRGRYEADPADEGEPTFVTVPYPYPSGGMHIGHARTYTVPDVYARYRRLQGDNVLFPLAWHVTGTPIVGAVERLQKGEEEQLHVLQDVYGVPEEDLAELETPMGFARYFVENYYKPNMKALGLSVDWRREFTTEDDRYSQFVTWQYESLRERDRLEKGLHPVNYCTNEDQPVTTHDLLEGEDAEFQEFTLVRFAWDPDGTPGADDIDANDDDTNDDGAGDDAAPAAGPTPGADEVVVPMATLRPETVRGVTNAFVHPDREYVLADVDGERWLVSVEATEKLELQAHDVSIRERFPGERLVGERVRNPVTGDLVPVLPATFVDPDNATGVVMSVPAHSPDDYAALAKIKDDPDRLREYGIDPETVAAVEPVPILSIEGYGDIPARDALETHGALGAPSDDPAIHEATEELYAAEFRDGKLVEAYGEYAGEVIEEVRDRFRADYADRGALGSMYEFTEEVICRCGGDVEVAEQDTWFLTYGDEDWKAETREALAGVDTIPENTRDQYDHTIDWLDAWPCIRNYGLGTPLPWDDEFVIEPLSDSTIYMAYYTLAHRIDEIPAEDLDPDFFEALFHGADTVDDPDPRALELREEFEHWYPVDYRCSGNDLINNHLTFFLFHHAELFDPDEWPEGITVMGMGLLEGEKMSSSKGHVVLPSEAIEEYGADTVRFFLLNSAEPWQDYDWRAEEVASARDQLEGFWERATEVIDAGAPDARIEGWDGDTGDGDSGDSDDSDEPQLVTDDGETLALSGPDRWLLSRLQSVVEEATDALDRFETRRASQEAFYRFEEDLRWYRRRADLDRPAARWVRREVLATRLRLLAPFVPFLANEIHERLTGEPAEEADWPVPDERLHSPRAEAGERLIEELIDDVREVVQVTGTDPEAVYVYTAAEWKGQVLDAVAEAGPDHGAVMGEVMSDPDLRERGDAVNDLVGGLIESVRGRDDDALAALREVDETAIYRDAAGFLGHEFDAEVVVVPEEEADDEKAGQAVPLRPAIRLA